MFLFFVAALPRCGERFWLFRSRAMSAITRDDGDSSHFLIRIYPC